MGPSLRIPALGKGHHLLNTAIPIEQLEAQIRVTARGEAWLPGSCSPHEHAVCLPQLGQEHKVPVQSAWLYYNVTEKVRRLMESYFRLDTPLYFSYSHLVCRTAIEGKCRWQGLTRPQ